jgi:hypothetical protein
MFRMIRKGLGSVAVLAVLCGAPAGEAAAAATVFISGNITTSETWTSDNEYVLTQPVYVTEGATLTIEAGTVVRGEPQSEAGANDPGTLIIARGSKIRALGTPTRPVVFTDLFDDNVGSNPGTFPYDDPLNALSLTGQWGGVILLGRGYVANNTLSGPDPTREVQIEGLTATGGLGLYGNGGDDDDDSGTLTYVSIRYGGFNLSANNEINGLTLGAVGRQTDLDHIEVFQNKDDAFEFFGGTVNAHHLVVANVGDDGVDYDEGWRGKLQHVFMLQGTPGTDKSDKGGEHDGGNNPDGSQPFAIPTIYNVTYVGLGQKAYTGKLTNTALHFRDNAGGRYYNSFFADFGGAPLCIENASLGVTAPQPNTSAERATTDYLVDGVFYRAPDSDFQLELRDSTFWCFGNGGAIPVGDASAYGCDGGKEHYDNGAFTNAALQNQSLSCAEPLPIRTLSRFPIGISTVPDPVTSIDPRPAAGSVLLTTDRTPPADGFFEPVSYRGAFAPGENWAEGWTNLSRLGYFPPKPQIAVAANIVASETWTSDNEYVLTQPVYVTEGATLTIEAGTVVRGEPQSEAGANDPGTLIIARGSKIRALGTPTRPVVFTDLFDDNVGSNPGTFPYDDPLNALSLTGQWGGVILLGRGYVANNTLSGPDPTREVQIEGLTATGGLGLYGNGGDDDDDSGTLTYVSIRYGGFNLSANNEINGLTLGAVGRQTDLDHIEVFQNKDDAFEFFGGTVNAHHLVVANVGDDGVDYDEGWRGKLQHVFMLQGTPGTDKSDKGGEHDGGNNPDGSQPFAIPTIYNVTYVGLGQKAYTGKLTNTALHFRDNAGGRYYNSFFADFGGAPLCIENASLGVTAPQPNTSAERATTDYLVDGVFYRAPDSDFQLELRDSTFWCFGNGGAIPVGDASAYGCDGGKEHYDNGAFTNAALQNQSLSCAEPLPIRTLSRFPIGISTVPDPVTSIDPRPVAGGILGTTDRQAPLEQAFSPAPFRGAFSPGGNWANGWTNLSRLGYFPRCDPAAAPLSIPDEVQDLSFSADRRTLAWTAPSGTYGAALFDVLRSTDRQNFTAPVCIETDDADATAQALEDPPVGQVFYYVVRGGNLCGEGAIGFASSGAERAAGACGP